MMPKYIDADKLKAYLQKNSVNHTLTDIDAQPTVDAEPVRHGRWEVVDGAEPRRYGCSVCKKLSWTEDNYCSYCGAKMDEVEE